LQGLGHIVAVSRLQLVKVVLWSVLDMISTVSFFYFNKIANHLSKIDLQIICKSMLSDLNQNHRGKI